MPHELLIAGERVPGDGPPLAVENPFDETTIATVGSASPQQVDAAITAAAEAAPAWAAMPTAERAELLHEIAGRLRERAAEQAALKTR